MASEVYAEMRRLDPNLSESDLSPTRTHGNVVLSPTGRANLYPGMYRNLDPNLSESDLSKLSAEGEFVRRRELELAALSPERVVVDEDRQSRGHLSLFRRVKAEACLALSHLPTILNYIY